MAFKKQSFLKGVLVIMFAQVVIRLLGFIYRVILTNIDGFQDVGNSYYGSGYKVYTFILAIATTGIPNTISKLVSEKIAVGDRRGAHRVFKTALKVFSLVGIFFALALFLGSGFIANSILANPGVRGTIATLAPAVLFVAIAAVFRGYFVGMQNMSAHSTAQVIEQIINSILSVVFVLMLLGNSPEVMAMGSTAATAVSTLVALIYLVMYYNRNKKDIWNDIKESKIFSKEQTKTIVRNIIRYVIPLSFASIVVALAGMVDLVTVVDGLQKFGYTLQMANEKFGILLGKVDILVSIPHAFNVALVIPLIPAITAHIARREKQKAIEKINSCMKISTIIAFPCAAGLTILAEPIFETIFPNASAGALLLQIEVWAVIFSLLAQTAYGSLHGIGKMYVPGLTVLIAAIIKYILNIIFIPKFGEVIVPITTIIYHVVACIISMTVLYKTIKTKPDFNNILFKPMIATFLMSIIVILSGKILVYINIKGAANMGISIVVGILTYAIVLVLTKCITKTEISEVPYGNKICNALQKKKKVEKKC